MSKRTKIICTIGPASHSPKILTALIRSGMDVARLNFSHGSFLDHALLIKRIRAVSHKLGVPVAIMQDLQGPKIRVANLNQPLKVKAGDEVVIGRDFKLDYDVAKWVRPGQTILIEDGLIELLVKKVVGKKIHCRVQNPGEIKNHKGVNLPHTHVKFPILTAKDITDLRFGLNQDVDYVALSFVRSKRDISNLKRLIKKYNPKKFIAPKVIAKIERPEAIKNIDEIIHLADAIMVARGDLGVELPDYEVPVLQKMIINKCFLKAKPVVVATQMLDSMIRNPRPTRAEVSDVANAVFDRADGVMLSGESAFGKYPVQAVVEMTRIIENTEPQTGKFQAPIFNSRRAVHERETQAAKLARQAKQLAERAQAKTIVAVTESGFIARFLAHQRPGQELLVVTAQEKIYRQMSLLWGVTPLLGLKRLSAKIRPAVVISGLPHRRKIELLR